MKKWSAVLLAMLLVFSMAACGESAPKQDAFDIYEQATAKAAEITSMEANITATVNMVMASEPETPIDLTLTGAMQQVIRTKTDFDLAMDMTLGMMGQSIGMKMYYKDGYMYQDMMGMKMKTAAPVDEVMDQMNVLDMENIKFSREDVKDMSMANVEGGTEINITFNGERMNTLITDLLSNMGMEDMLGTVSMTMSDIQFKMVVDADMNAKVQHIIFDATVEVEGEVVTMSADVLVETSAVNTLEAVTLPADLDSYIDMDESMAALEEYASEETTEEVLVEDVAEEGEAA